MGYMTDGLTLNVLREANKKRQIQCFPQCTEWTPSQWLQALVGEIGEYANIRKKFERGSITEAEFKEQGSKELADIQTYLDLLAASVGVNLGQSTIDKFN